MFSEHCERICDGRGYSRGFLPFALPILGHHVSEEKSSQKKNENENSGNDKKEGT